MTRINLVKPNELSDQHLLAEMRELPRIFTHVNKYGVSKDIPQQYCLGSGHVKFFTNKLRFLCGRYFDLISEWEKRGFNWSYHYGWFFTKNEQLMYGVKQIVWEPTAAEIETSKERIQEKLNLKPNYYRWSK